MLVRKLNWLIFVGVIATKPIVHNKVQVYSEVSSESLEESDSIGAKKDFKSDIYKLAKHFINLSISISGDGNNKIKLIHFVNQNQMSHKLEEKL